MVGKHILVVEDDPAVARIVCESLQTEGYDCRQIANGADALASVQTDPPDLIVLDRVLPGLAGDEVIQRLRGNPDCRRIPVIMLTGKSEESDELVGLALGADDYLTKPFSVKRLLARIAAKLRHEAAEAMPREGMPTRSLTLDRTQSRVVVDQTAIPLSNTEHRVLAALMAARGHVLHRRQLSTLLFGEQGDPQERSIDEAVRELRRKLGPAAGCVQVVTPETYAFCAPPGQSAPA